MSRANWREKEAQMSITPGDGWLERGLDLNTSTGPTAHCPNCHSSEWKSASFVYQEGRSVTSSRTKGTSIGIARVGLLNGRFAIGGGAYQSRTRGSEQTMLSAMATPPQKRSVLIVLLSIICIVLVGAAISSFQAGQSLTSMVDVSLAIGMAIILAAIYARRANSYNAAINAYDDTKVCQRCGTFYVGNTAHAIELGSDANQGDGHTTMLGLGALLVVLSLVLAFLQRSRSPNVIVDGPANLASTGLPSSSRATNWSATADEGLPKYIADALRTPNLAPVESSMDKRELALGIAGQEQVIPALGNQDCEGSGGCNWHMLDAATQEEILPDSQGLLYKTKKITNGYYDIVVAHGTAVEEHLYANEYRKGKYENTSCYKRRINPDGPAVPTPCP